MKNKIIFISLTVVLFLAAGAAGYYGPGWLREREMAGEQADFIPAGVPKSIESGFAAHFRFFGKSTDAKRLPGDSFVDTDGKTVRFADFNGRPTLVNFWATWCAPCVVELPMLEKLADHYKGRMNVVAVSLEQGKKPSEIATFLDRRELGRFAAYVDESGAVAKNLGLRGLPTSFLVGSDGLILYRFEGDADWTSQESTDFFDIFLLQKR